MSTNSLKPKLLLNVFIVSQNVERSFGLLKKRFPRIVKLNQKTSEKKVVVVMAACALHNICIQEKDNINYFLSAAEQVSFVFLPPATKFGQGNIFRSVCQELCPQEGGGDGGIPAWLAGVIPACLAVVQGHTQGELDPSGHGEGLQANTREVSWPTLCGGVSQHTMRHTPPAHGYCRGLYASYWNAFLSSQCCVTL